LTGVLYENDFGHPDSTAQYRKVVVTVFGGAIEVPGSPDTTVYEIASRQELYVVRGDAAVLPAGAAADTTHWYVRRWDDLTSPVGSPKLPTTNPGRGSSLGIIKSMYR
jgi:hypothetical protein